VSSAGATLPDFLIIGGMKCGSTTLYRDLERHPDIFFPLDKEPNALCDDRVLTPEGAEAYAGLFRDARPGQRRGEASTAYTKLPHYAGVADRARRLLGPDLRLIYILRDPIARLLSHHRHEGELGRLPADLAAALDASAGLVEYSCYARQLEPWLDAFDRARLLVLRFEDYVRDRRAHAARACAHLGVARRDEIVDESRVYNRSDGKPVVKGPWKRVVRSGFYRERIRPLLSVRMRERIRHAVLPKARFEPLPPSADLLERLVDTLQRDIDRLPELLGPDAPTWDLRARWLEARPSEPSAPSPNPPEDGRTRTVGPRGEE